jgi:hypothetical protein
MRKKQTVKEMRNFKIGTHELVLSESKKTSIIGNAIRVGYIHAYNILIRKTLEERDNLGYLGVGGRIILK